MKIQLTITIDADTAACLHANDWAPEQWSPHDKLHALIDAEAASYRRAFPRHDERKREAILRMVAALDASGLGHTIIRE